MLATIKHTCKLLNKLASMKKKKNSMVQTLNFTFKIIKGGQLTIGAICISFKDW